MDIGIGYSREHVITCAGCMIYSVRTGDHCICHLCLHLLHPQTLTIPSLAPSHWQTTPITTLIVATLTIIKFGPIPPPWPHHCPCPGLYPHQQGASEGVPEECLGSGFGKLDYVSVHCLNVGLVQGELEFPPGSECPPASGFSFRCLTKGRRRPSRMVGVGILGWGCMTRIL